MRISTRSLALSALLAALVCVATIAVRIPIPASQGYINFGDAFIVTAAVVFGRRYGALAGALGASIADIIGGYPIWAPWTLAIKGIEGYSAGAIGDAHGLLRNAHAVQRNLVCSVAGGIIILAGYFVGSFAMYGIAAALSETTSNLIQASGSLVAAQILIPLLQKARLSAETR